VTAPPAQDPVDMSLEDNEDEEESDIEDEERVESDSEAAEVSLLTTVREAVAVVEETYYDAETDLVRQEDEIIPELGLVGAGIGGGFDNTSELRPMKYKEAMATSDKAGWEVAVKEEHDRMDGGGVMKAVPESEVPKGAHLMDTTWAMKKKASGVLRARLVIRGFKQVDGEHFDADEISSPVVNLITIHIVLVLIIIMGWYACIVDVKGAFLIPSIPAAIGRIFLKMPEGFEKFYPPHTVMEMKKSCYGMKQASALYYKTTVKFMKELGFERSNADPCLFYNWDDSGLVLCICWIDDLLWVGKKENVLKYKKQLSTMVAIDDVGELKEYIGNKIDMTAE